MVIVVATQTSLLKHHGCVGFYGQLDPVFNLFPTVLGVQIWCMYVSNEHSGGTSMENYNDQSHTVHVELNVHKDSIVDTVAFYASRTNATE